MNSQARQAAADRAWAAFSRFYARCRANVPGKKGYPRFQHDGRSVEYKQTGWKLDPEGKHLTLTDGCAIGRLKTRRVATFPVDQLKWVRLLRRADGYYAQVVIQADRRVVHPPTGKALGLDVGLRALVTDSDGTSHPHPRFLRKAEVTLKRRHRQLSRKSPQHRHAKGCRKANHAHHRRAIHNKYLPQAFPPPPHASSIGTDVVGTSKKEPPSKNSLQARNRLARAYLKVSRQREDHARELAGTLISSCDLITFEHLLIRNLVKNHTLAKSIHDASWGRLRHWLEYYAHFHGIAATAVPPQWTSQTCSGCGQVVRKSLSERTHRCLHCGLIADRDHNAALTILHLAYRTGGHPGTTGFAP